MTLTGGSKKSGAVQHVFVVSGEHLFRQAEIIMHLKALINKTAS